MRIMIKGGVWKNTEDEILKAAVMKYGKNQWARISSLLVRKSAKQCKARWYEWLDPSIKKTEWTREEDEKLLHLAKLMPTQWRTIAPIVGRTPSQCLERYEKLLDAACVKDENYEPADDPRKLRPGEIDPNPESKPARPDPVDMDEDEKEMLSEARARLANTRGKKAKRKAREKQLEEARRLASLQKRRELKAAGIDGKQRRRKRKGIDYNSEIPFEKKPPPGFFDVSDEETRQVEQPNFPTTIEELEGKRRVDVEAQLRKQDVARNKIMQRHDAPTAVMQVNKLNDPEAVRKRAKLMLPSPQISDRELEEIAKMGYASDLVLGEDELAEGSGAARALLANYGQTPRLGMTPLRTPQRTPGGKGDAIMMEAENQARLRESQTPLFGGENPELHPSDFSGVTPKKREIQTPNPIATPLHTPGAVGLTPRIGMTPSREFSMTPKGTPIRDELHINEGMETPDSSKAESRRQAEIRRNLLAGLSELPVPRNEYQIVVPELPTEDIEVGHQLEEDMSDKLARERAEEAARQEALLRKRSKVLQRDLPRPPISSVDFIKNSLTRVDDDKGPFAPTNFIEQADELIRKELVSLLEHDNAKYPFEEDQVKEKKKGSKGAPNGRLQVPIPYIDDFDEEEINEASQLIEEQVSILRVGMGHEDASLDDFSEAHDACLEDMMYFPGRNSYGLGSVASVTDKLAATQNDFENVRNHMESETRKAVRLEQKLKVLTQGYNMRAGKLWTQIEAAFKQADTSGTELECFRSLHKQEQLAASNRIEGLREAVNQQKEFERQLQLQYQNLLVEQDNLQRLLQEHKEMMAHLKESSKENVVDTQQLESVIAQVDTGHLEDSNSEVQPFSISSKCNDVEMMDGSGVVEEEKTSDNSSDMHIDHVPQPDGQNPVLEGEIIEQIPQQTKEVVQVDVQSIVLQDEKIVLQDENIEHNRQPTDLIIQSNGQNPVFKDEDVEQVKQQCTSPVAQSDGQNYAIQNENAGQVKNQQKSPQSSISSQNDINKDVQAVSVEMHHPIPTSTEGQDNAIHNENLGQVENQQELSQPSIYSQNDMNKDAAAVSVEMQLPIQNPTDRQNDAVHNENVGQVENQQELAQSSVHNENVGQVENQQELAQSSVHSENVGRVENQQELAQSSKNAQNDINKDAAALSVDMQHTIQNVDRDSSPSHLNDQFNGSDLLEENVSAQIQQSVGDKTDIVMGVSKVISQEPVPLCKADTEGEIVVSIAEAQQAVVDKTDIVKGVSKVTSQEPVPLCKADTEGEIVVSMAKVDTAAVHAEDVNLQS